MAVLNIKKKALSAAENYSSAADKA